MDVQDQLALFYWVRLGSGVFVVISALMFVWAVLVPGREKQATSPAASAAGRVSSDGGRALSRPSPVRSSGEPP